MISDIVREYIIKELKEINSLLEATDSADKGNMMRVEYISKEDYKLNGGGDEWQPSYFISKLVISEVERRMLDLIYKIKNEDKGECLKHDY